MAIYYVDEKNEDDRIRGVNGNGPDENGRVTVTWLWPANRYYDKCVIFAVDESNQNASPEVLWDTLPHKIYGETFNVKHLHQLRGKGCRFRIFPAHREGNDLTIVRQSNGNLSELFVNKVTIHYHVSYSTVSRGFLKLRKEPYRIAQVTVDSLEGYAYPYLNYQISDNENSNRVYGVDLDKFKNGTFQLALKPEQEIRLVAINGQEKNVNFIRS